jgi:PAS domain S-box-containing protein
MSGPGETAGGERNKEWYRTLVEEANDVTLVVDSDGTVTYASPALERLLDYIPSALVGGDLCEFALPKDRDTLFEAIETLQTDPSNSETVEFRCRQSDGTRRWLEATMRSRLNTEIDGIIVNIRDITERKQRESELQTTKERMKMALEGASLGIWDWDMVTDEVVRDELLTEMLGYTRSEMGDHLNDWERVVHPEGKMRHDEALAEHIENRTPYYQCEYRLETKSGDWKWVRTMGKVVERDGTGEPVRAVGIHQDIDDRKRAELALEAERDMFKQGPAVVFKWEDAGEWPITYVSENVEGVFGYTADELRSSEIVYADLVHDEDLDRVEQELDEYNDEGTDMFSPDPYRILTSDGEVRWVMEYTKEREKRLEVYQSLFEHTSDCIVRTEDINGEPIIRDVNAAFERTFGYDRETLIDESLDEFIVSERFEDEAARLNQRLLEENHVRAEVTRMTADGPREFLLRSAYYEQDAGYIVYTDITDRKEYERELEAREEKYRNLFEDTRDALMLLDRDGFFDCNEQTLDLFGVESVEAFVDYSPWDLSPATQPDGSDSKAAALERVEEAFEEGEAFFEWTHQHLDGTDFPAEVKLSRFEHQGEPALHALVRDITERREYERQLEEQRDNLDVLNQVLRHDIRNDLQLIITYGELLERKCDDEEVHEYIETVLENADHAVELTKSAREMADVMLSAEKELQQVDLGTVLESELEEVQATYPEADITKETTVPLVSVQANDMLGSVFRNLLKNAIQHNDKAVAKVTVSGTDRDKTVVVRVADNGPGVPDRQKVDIFGKGEKGLDSQGTGIGLYLVKTLVESYGGDIWVEDRDGHVNDDEPEGAVFVVELPKGKSQ